MIKASIILDEVKAREAVRERAVAVVQSRANEAAALIEAQIKRRFRDNGDEEERWPDLWASNDAAVRRMADAQSTGGGKTLNEGRAVRKREWLKAHSKYQDAREQRADDAKLKRLKNKSDRLFAIYRSGNPSYRRGGKPLRDTGALAASVKVVAVATPKGFVIEAGSTLPYGRYHNEGFQTSGLNYIPLTMKGARKPRGMNPDTMGLIRGHDYVLARGVKIPRRRFVKFTRRNLADVRRAVTRRA